MMNEEKTSRLQIEINSEVLMRFKLAAVKRNISIRKLLTRVVLEWLQANEEL